MNKYYEILDLKPGATKEEIKKAWKKKSLEYHPDRNPSEDATTKIQEINEAYEILIGKKQPPREEIPNQGGFRGNPFNNPFNNPFAGFRMKSRPISILVDVTLEDIFYGVNKNIRFNVNKTCNTCQGKGGKTTTCTHCNGRGGKIEYHQVMGMQTMTMCSHCGGSGQMRVDTCGTCHGAGIINHIESFDLKIPKGLTEGGRLIIQGLGSEGHNLERGDVVVNFNIQPHPKFQLEGLNLHKTEELPFVDMILGKEIEIESLSGKFKVNIPQYCESNKVIRLKGQGLIDEDTGITGDLYVKLTPKVPKTITEKEKELLQELRHSINFS
jgi:molecular chaperone DnaJ